MPKFVKLPITIEAFRMGIDPRPDWFTEKIISNDIITYYVNPRPDDSDLNSPKDPFESRKTYCIIKTLEGEMKGNYGDYIIKGINGEIYPCKPDIFTKTYAPAAGEDFDFCPNCGHMQEIESWEDGKCQNCEATYTWDFGPCLDWTLPEIKNKDMSIADTLKEAQEVEDFYNSIEFVDTNIFWCTCGSCGIPVDINLNTCCPNCKTKFEVKENTVTWYTETREAPNV